MVLLPALPHASRPWLWPSCCCLPGFLTTTMVCNQCCCLCMFALAAVPKCDRMRVHAPGRVRDPQVLGEPLLHPHGCHCVWEHAGARAVERQDQAEGPQQREGQHTRCQGIRRGAKNSCEERMRVQRMVQKGKARSRGENVGAHHREAAEGGISTQPTSGHQTLTPIRRGMRQPHLRGKTPINAPETDGTRCHRAGLNFLPMVFRAIGVVGRRFHR